MSGQLFTNDFIAVFQQGRYRAVNDLYREHFSVLYDLAFQLVQDGQVAYDIVLETFIKLFHMRADFDTGANIKAFLYITTRNNCLAYLRYGRSEEKSGPGFDYTSTAATPAFRDQDDQAFAEAIRQLYRETEQLPADYRKVFQLLYCSGQDVARVAAQLDIEPAKVPDLKTKAFHRLQQELRTKENLCTPLLIYYIAIECYEKSSTTA